MDYVFNHIDLKILNLLIVDFQEGEKKSLVSVDFISSYIVKFPDSGAAHSYTDVKKHLSCSLYLKVTSN